MVNLILYILSCIGLSTILVESAIFEPFRAWLKKDKDSKLKIFVSKIFSCLQCMGFWTGLVCGMFLMPFNVFTILCCGFAGSFISPFSALVYTYLEAAALVNINSQDNNES